MEYKKAIKTEYSGIVFDSKSEAVFARTLDIGGHEWFYHPEEHCGHAWDFLIFRRPLYISPEYALLGPSTKTRKVYVSKKKYQVNPPPILVEYKPQAPTDTYINNLTDAMRTDPFESIIVWGNPWNGPPETGLNIDDMCSYVAYPIFTKHDGEYGWGNYCRQLDHGDEIPYSLRHIFTEMFGVSESNVQSAREYRFDLLHH